MKRILFLILCSIVFLSSIYAEPKFSFYKGSSKELRNQQKEMDLNRQFKIEYNNKVQMNNATSYSFNYESATEPVSQSSCQYVNQETDIHGSWYTAANAGGGGGIGGGAISIQVNRNNSFARDMVNTAKSIFSSSAPSMNIDISDYGNEACEIDESFGGFTGIGTIAGVIGLDGGLDVTFDGGGLVGPAPPSDGPLGDALLPLGLMVLAFSILKFRKK
ncbi:MAG: hypothetical protein MJZ93_04985 [Paludibacteraceae bacterium]|nr:hypothetical protein [Paludibacteraceae bacterium]